MRLSTGMRSCALIALVLLVTSRGASAANTADLGIRVNGPNVRNGEVALYTVYVANAGPSATNDVVTVTLSLPDGFSFVSAGGNGFTCSPRGGEITCTRQAPLSVGSLDFPLQFNVCAATPRAEIGVAIDYSGDNNLASNRGSRGTSVRSGPCSPVATPTSPSAPATTTPTPTITPGSVASSTDLTIAMSRASRFRLGGTGTYSVVLANNGPAATNQPITITDTLPSGLSFLSASGDGWTCNASGQVVRCTYSAMLSGADNTSFLLNVRVARSTAPSVTNVAMLDYAGDTDSSNNSAGRPTTIRR